MKEGDVMRGRGDHSLRRAVWDKGLFYTLFLYMYSCSSHQAYRVPLPLFSYICNVNAVRDVYEALCIHCFLALMLDFPGGEDAVIEGIKEKGKMKHPKPFCFCPQMRLGVDFIVNMKR